MIGAKHAASKAVEQVAVRNKMVFEKLVSGEVHGLVDALVRGNPDLLPAADKLGPCRTHLEGILNGMKDGYLSDLKQRALHKGKHDLCKACCGNCSTMERDELYLAYAALAKEVQTATSLSILAPTKYKIRQAPNGDKERVKESPHARDTFELSEVRLEDVALLHLAIHYDAELAANGNSTQYVERLLKAQADVNCPAHYKTEAVDASGRELRTAVSPIHVAVDRNSVDVVTALLFHKASPETRAVFDMRADYTPLHLAAVRGFEGIAHMLIDAGANVSETDLSQSCCFDILQSSVRLTRPPTCARIGEKQASQINIGRAHTELISGSQQGNAQRSETIGTIGSSSSWTDDAAPVRGMTDPQLKPDVDCRVLFQEALDALKRLQEELDADCGGSSGSTMALPSDAPYRGDHTRPARPLPTQAQLKQRVQEGLQGADVNDLFGKKDEPDRSILPERRFYKRNKVIHRGCLLHYAVDRAVEAEGNGDAHPEGLVHLVLRASADIHARAHYKCWDQPHTCTALHIAAAGGAMKTTDLLLKSGASLEAMVTNDMKPHYTPLLDAASEGHYEVCALLLEKRANPNVPNRLGRTCLHNAVLDGRGDLARLLTEHGSDVTLADSIFGETALLCTIRAKTHYPVADMMWLCRAYHDSRFSLLHDLSSLAVSRGQLAVHLLEYVLHKDKSEPARLTEKKEQLLRQLRRVAVEGKPDEDGLTPVDHLATIMESAPQAGVRLFDQVLCIAPDVQDTIHGTLPVYANLRANRDSWLPWRRWRGKAEPMLTEYQPDVHKRKPDGREWPCWLFNFQLKDAEPEWHTRFNRMETKHYEEGNHMVQMKVLLLANVLDAKIMKALGTCHNIEIFAELPIRSLLNYMYNACVDNVLLMEKLLEASLIIALIVWAKGDQMPSIRRLCWMWCAAVPFNDIVLLFWKLWRYLALQHWSIKGFFPNFENPGGMLVHLSHGLLLLYTMNGDDSDKHSLDTADDRTSLVRELLATVIILRSLKVMLLFSYGDTFGKDLLAVYTAGTEVFTMLSIMLLCFASFFIAIFVMKVKVDGAHDEFEQDSLIQMVYKALLLGDDDSLSDMEKRWGGPIGSVLASFGTAVFTIYLLNIMIAVLSAKYFSADRNAELILQQQRALKSAQVLLGPVIPWSLRDVFRERGDSTGGGDARGMVAGPSQSESMAANTSGAGNHEARPEGEEAKEKPPDPEVEAARSMRWLLNFSMTVMFGIAAVLSVVQSCHAVFGAVVLGTMLITIRARLVRSQSWNAEHRDRRFYLWVCHRSDYSRLTFVTEDVAKEHVDDLKHKVESMEVLIQDMHRRMCSADADRGEASERQRRSFMRASTFGADLDRGRRA